MFIKKRDGRIEEFDSSKIKKALENADECVAEEDRIP